MCIFWYGNFTCRSQLLKYHSWLNMSPLKSTCWSPHPRCDGIRRWGLWGVPRVSGGPEGGTPWWDECPHKKRKTRAHWLSAIWAHSKKASPCKQEERCHHNLTMVAILISEVPASRTVRKTHLLCKSPAYGILFWQPELPRMNIQATIQTRRNDNVL